MDAQPRLTVDPSNAGQVGAWDGRDGDLWVARARRFDEGIAACHGPFLDAAAIGPGDRVLDIGCGTGQATRDAARRAVDGFALGVDLSSRMLALGTQLAIDEGLDNVEFRHADAQIHDFGRGTFDGVISRMGSMFFGDPVAAFTNLRGALRPDGRLTLLTWQRLDDNEWITEFRAAMAVGRDLPKPPPHVPSPFALADPDRVVSILDAAGFTDVSFESLCAPMYMGADPDDAFDFISTLTGWMRDELDDAGRDAALSALRASIAEHTGDDGVTYGCATWIIRARPR